MADERRENKKEIRTKGMRREGKDSREESK